MSFRKLKEEIYFVLEIKTGHGFGFTASPLLVTASLGASVHESFTTEPCLHPKFESEFVWVMNKVKLKSIWAEKTPVRVECFTVEQSRRNRIGYAILNAKDAQIVEHESKITDKHVRLLGLNKEASLAKPELEVSLYITDVPIQSPGLVAQFSPPLQDGRLCVTQEPVRVSLGSGREHFTLRLTPGPPSNLSQLLPSQSDVEPDLLTYSYSLLGAELLADSSTNHSLRLALTCSLTCLKTYFAQQPCVRVTLRLGSLVVGEASIDVSNLLLTEEHVRRLRRTATVRCDVLPCLGDGMAAAASLEPRPHVDFTVSFTHDTPAVKKKQDTAPIPPLVIVSSRGDAEPLVAPHTPRLGSHSPPSASAATGGGGGGGDTYRTSCRPPTPALVCVTVLSLRLADPLPPHPWLRLCCNFGSVQGDGQQSISADNWTSVEYRLVISAHRHLLGSMLTAQPPLLQLGEGEGEGEGVFATATLLPPDTLSLQPSEVTIDIVSQGEKVGETRVSWTVAENSGQHTANQRTAEPPATDRSQEQTSVMDTSLSAPTHSNSVNADFLTQKARDVKMQTFVEELEEWAERQRVLIMEGLKEEKAARLAALQREWEAEVGSQLVEGRQMVGALAAMRDQLRAQEEDLQENQLKLKMYKEELERAHRGKLEEFKDLSRRMQDEYNHKLRLIATDKDALEQEVEDLRDENSEMKQRLNELESNAEDDKKMMNSLKHELKLLKDKLKMEEESKRFFKEHCRKSEQEIYRLNCLRQQELEARLATEKKSLEQLAFQQIVVEKHDLRQDQQLLQEIRGQLLHGVSDCNEGTSSEASHIADERRIRRAT